MLVTMFVAISGTIDGQEWPPIGGTIDVPAQVADDLVANGYAAASTARTRTVAAVDPVEETAAKPATRARKTTKK